MCWICDHPESTRDDYVNELRAEIRRCGWAVQYVESDRVPFAYTVGLTQDGLPELLITGVSPRRAVRLLNSVARGAADPLTLGAQIAIPSGPLAEIVQVAQPDAHLDMAVEIFGSELEAWQLVWADRRGRWPWSADFNDGRGGQPVLGVRAGST
jgi:Domain of unknown function (DUF4262)